MRSIIQNGSDELPPNEVRGHYLGGGDFYYERKSYRNRIHP